MSEVVLSARDLKKDYFVKKGFGKKIALRALNGVSFDLQKTKTLGVVGESGCGKSTLAKVLMHIEPATGGTVELNGKNWNDIPIEEYRKKVQLVFQDPYASINPRKKAEKIIAEPLYINTELSDQECKERVQEMMEKVGLRPEFAGRYPHMFSGGQRQRIGIARALVLNPQILLLDEPVSALDVSIQAQVINLLIELQDQFDLSYIFVSHDLSVVKHLVDDVIVMYLGKVVERGSRQQIFSNAQHPYTKALLASTPQVKASQSEKEKTYISGELPTLYNPPSGCPFHKRCPIAEDRCSKEVPTLKEGEAGHEVSCLLV